MRLPGSQRVKIMKNKTLMEQVRLLGTVLVTPFLVGGAGYVVWEVIDRILNWPTQAQGGVLSEVFEVSQILCGVAGVALALTLTGSLWLRCFPRRRACKAGAAKLPNPFRASGKYAAWKFQRPLRRQALFGPLTIRKKTRSTAIRPKRGGP